MRLFVYTLGSYLTTFRSLYPEYMNIQGFANRALHSNNLDLLLTKLLPIAVGGTLAIA